MNDFSKLSSSLMSPYALASGVMLTLLSAPVHLVHANALEQAFSEGKASINARYRYETAKDSNTATEDATASTLRTRLGFTTSDKYALSAHMDFEHITSIGDIEFNSLANGQTQYSIIADEPADELNQAYLKYKFSDSVTVIGGRQRIILDNARFIGNVGWRQNEQTFDALRISITPSKDLSIDLANIQQANTITAGTAEMSTNLLNIGYSGIPGGKLSAYAYMLDYDAPSANSTSTIGLRYKGASDKLLYTLEYATQSDYGDNPGSFDADYLFGELGYKISKGNKVFVGMETLGSDNGAKGFDTKLATKHAFNGWADMFLKDTPADGLQDLYLKAVTKIGGVKLVGLYHDYSADFGSVDYGSELNLVAIKPLSKSIKALVKYADYDHGTSGKPDAKKVWFQLEMALKQ